MDIWAAHGIGVEDGGAPGQTTLWDAGKLRDEVGFGWGGMKMRWTHQQGHKGKQGQARDQERGDILGSAREVEA